jgi:hypothetical protein
MIKMLKKIFKQIINNMNVVNVNGNSYTSTRSISIINGKVIIDGNDVTPDGKEINISIKGAVDSLNVDACSKIYVNGNVKTLKTISGDVEVTGGIEGDVNTTSGDIDCGGNIGGSVRAVSGDIDCGEISGNANTVSGNIKQRKN